jgi:alpha-N-acetylglucosamine transferase
MSAAYVTTLCNGDRYMPGVEALGCSLDRTGTPHPKVVLVTADVSRRSRRALSDQGWQVRDVDPIENPIPRHRQFFPRFARTFTKLRAFALTEFDKLVLLDADTIVLQNVDDLFERPAIAAAPDFLLPDRFNSGVMVLEPSAALFGRMMDMLFTHDSYDGGDQGFLNNFFSDWYGGPAEHRLPAGYNLHQFIYQFMRAHPTLLPQLTREAKIIHYTVQKPWLSTSTLAGGSEAWWEMYFDAHPEAASGWRGFRRRMSAMEDWSYNQMLRVLG